MWVTTAGGFSVSVSLSKSIRLKRLRIKEGHSVNLQVEVSSGKVFSFAVFDCSLTGLAANADWTESMSEELVEGDICPTSKMSFGNSEVSLGRLVIRRVPATNAGPKGHVAFSTIDAKVPVDGNLSSHLEIDFDSNETPFDYELPSNRFTIADFATAGFNNVDILNRTEKFGVFYNHWRNSDKFGYFQQRQPSMGSRIKLARARPAGRNDYLMMGSNDYLGLAAHPAVSEAAVQAIREYGFGSTGTPHTSGYSAMHDRLRDRLARMYGKEDALIFASGYSANVGILSGLCREQDLVLADILSHASLHDGIAMSRATCRLFKHNDMNHLRKLLEDNRSQYAGCLIVTEGAFSMDGTIGKLDEIHKLAREFNARVMIDQAHCIGVVGATGLGVVEKFGLIEQTDVIMGLFSKALGTVGGFVVGSSNLCNWLRSFSRSFIFASSFPPSTAAATIRALELMQTEGLINRLRDNITHFVQGMREIGAPLDPNHETAIVPIEIRNEEKLGKMYKSLLDSGVVVVPVVYPVVSRNRSRFRFSVRADLSITDLDYAVAAFERAMKEADFSFSELVEEKKAN